VVTTPVTGKKKKVGTTQRRAGQQRGVAGRKFANAKVRGGDMKLKTRN